jgi:SAM-dependent methyltransferase
MSAREEASGEATPHKVPGERVPERTPLLLALTEVPPGENETYKDGSFDGYDLYEWCVQAPLKQATFLDALCGSSTGGGVRALRDDFCGPASIARAWLTLPGARRAVGIDRDDEPFEHAKQRWERDAPAGMGDALKLVKSDVRAARERDFDVVCAFNFAVCELHTRADLVEYLRAVHAALKPGGVFAADLYGGTTAMLLGSAERRTETPIGTVYYMWEQFAADPFKSRVRNAIHFRLASTVFRNAFVYDWRLWSPAELIDAMREAGFASTEVHMGYGGAIDEQDEIKVQALGPEDTLDDDERDAWVVYVVARRG